jgi:hypothetical protein
VQREITYPEHVSDYSAVAPGPLNLPDTESQFGLASLDPDTHLPPIYTLPGIPYNLLTTPTERLLTVNAGGAGSLPRMVAICPPDYQLQPVPLLADFRAIVLQQLTDFARVRWTGFLWSIVEVSGTAVVVVPGQTFP